MFISIYKCFCIRLRTDTPYNHIQIHNIFYLSYSILREYFAYCIASARTYIIYYNLYKYMIMYGHKNAFFFMSIRRTVILIPTTTVVGGARFIASKDLFKRAISPC